MSTTRAHAALLFGLLATCSGTASCIGPRAPTTARPFTVRLVGGGGGALAATKRGDALVFTGRAGYDYGIEITNDTPNDVGIAVVLDGLDASNGEPAASCEGLGGWEVKAFGTAVVRGFEVSDTHIATYRFSTAEGALAAITQGARRDRIGFIEVCFFGLKPSLHDGPHTPRSFEGVVTSAPSPAQTPIVGEVQAESHGDASNVVNAALISRIAIVYEDDHGARLGTAPPPAGVARVSLPAQPRVTLAPSDDLSDDAPVKTTKPDKRGKPPKPYKGTKEEKAIPPKIDK